MTTPLLERLKAQISVSGPITVAEYMAACLGDRAHGYYTTAEPFGVKGDFITAPEVSQMFGELIGAFLVTAFQDLGDPQSVSLVELGPGRGTLMADILRMARLRPALINAVELHLVETSPRLREVQKNTLKKAPLMPTFHDRLAGVPDGPVLIVANEFFDALPIHQFVKTHDGWHERVIGLDDAGELAFGVGTARLDEKDVPKTARNAAPGTILETQPAANAICEEIGARLSAYGGVALFIDYGYLRSAPGDTLQAVHGHAYDPVLARPGGADLTAHVNFEALAHAAKRAGAVAFAPLTQGDFLLKLGLLERAGALGSGKSPAVQDDIRAAVERLAGPERMGELFKVFAISSHRTPISPFDRLWHPDQ